LLASPDRDIFEDIGCPAFLEKVVNYGEPRGKRVSPFLFVAATKIRRKKRFCAAAQKHQIRGSALRSVTRAGRSRL
jgi:hypothetical protein